MTKYEMLWMFRHISSTRGIDLLIDHGWVNEVKTLIRYDCIDIVLKLLSAIDDKRSGLKTGMTKHEMIEMLEKLNNKEEVKITLNWHDGIRRLIKYDSLDFIMELVDNIEEQ